MRLGPEHLGPRGLMLLGAAGVLGVALAVHGYGKGVVVTSGTAGVVSASQPPATTATTTPSTTTPPSKAAGSTTTSTSAAPSAQKPGPPSPRPGYRLATRTRSIRVAQLAGPAGPHRFHRPRDPWADHHHGEGLGDRFGAAVLNYPLGDKVYFVETTLGDDSGVSDYSFGDDGILVTNAAGRIVE